MSINNTKISFLDKEFGIYHKVLKVFDIILPETKILLVKYYSLYNQTYINLFVFSFFNFFKCGNVVNIMAMFKSHIAILSNFVDDDVLFEFLQLCLCWPLCPNQDSKPQPRHQLACTETRLTTPVRTPVINKQF